MPKYRHEDYQCIRCGYHIDRKSSMYNHLYKSKKPCPTTLNKIELTDELKQEILTNRVVKLPEDNTAKVINNIQMFNNFLGNMDPIEKLTDMLEYQNNNLLGFGEHIEEKHKVKIKKLEYDEYRHLFKINHDDMVDMIDDATQIKHGIKEMNIIYNHKYDKIYMYHDDEWNEYRKERGLQQIVRVYQTYFFDYYEKFLVKRMYQNPNVNARMRNDCQHQLRQYYRYLAIFELKPYTSDCKNTDLVTGGPYREYPNDEYLQEQLMNMYDQAKSELKKTEIREYKKTLLDIIKKNSQSNVKGLNDSITSLFDIDEEFKKVFLSKYKLG